MRVVLASTPSDRVPGKVSLAAAAHPREGSRDLGSANMLAIGPGLVNHERLIKIGYLFRDCCSPNRCKP
jgi:hypothetical protein